MLMIYGVTVMVYFIDIYLSHMSWIAFPLLAYQYLTPSFYAHPSALLI